MYEYKVGYYFLNHMPNGGGEIEVSNAINSSLTGGWELDSWQVTSAKSPKNQIHPSWVIIFMLRRKKTSSKSA
jgi:hypothetical protein